MNAVPRDDYHVATFCLFALFVGPAIGTLPFFFFIAEPALIIIGYMLGVGPALLLIAMVGLERRIAKRNDTYILVLLTLTASILSPLIASIVTVLTGVQAVASFSRGFANLSLLLILPSWIATLASWFVAKLVGLSGTPTRMGSTS